MAKELPYLSSYKNVDALFKKIVSAKQPEAFTTRYLADVIGLKGSADRSLISLLKSLGFLDGSGRPTAAYGLLKNPIKASFAIADGIRQAYEPLFTADEKANELAFDQLKGLIAQVAGSDEGMTAKIAGTFNTLVKLGNFSGSPTETKDEADNDSDDEEEKLDSSKEAVKKLGAAHPLRPEFHYNIQIHLPSNATEDVYLSIFNAIRKAFK